MGNGSQDLKQRPRRNAGSLLAPRDLVSLISFITQHHLPGSGTTHSGLQSSTTIQSSVKTIAHRLATGQSDGDIVSTEVPSSQTTLAYAKLTKPKEHPLGTTCESSDWKKGAGTFRGMPGLVQACVFRPLQIVLEGD